MYLPGTSSYTKHVVIFGDYVLYSVQTGCQHARFHLEVFILRKMYMPAIEQSFGQNRTLQ